MSLQDCKAVYGLSGVGSNSRTNVSGSCTVGIGQTSLQLTASDEGFSTRMILVGASTDGQLNLTTGSTAGSDSWTAGVAQVETNTIVAAGGCTSDGTMALVVTAAGLTGSPLTVNVALTTTAHTTAALIAEAARTALAANAAVAAMFTVGGATADISLTRLPTNTFTVPGGTLDVFAADDATLNLAIPAGLGVTASATSTDTTAGVASSGVKIYDGGVNFEGNAIETMDFTSGVLIKCALGQVWANNIDLSVYVDAGGVYLNTNNTTAVNITDTITLTTTTTTDITITVMGQKAV